MPAYLQPLCEHTGLPVMHAFLYGNTMHNLEVAELNLLHLRGHTFTFYDICVGVVRSDILLKD